MDQVIVYNVAVSESCPSGVCIEVPTGEVALEEVVKKLPAEAKNVHITTRETLPSDRYFRNAWKIEGEKIDVDMLKAKQIHIEKLRPLRNEKLKKLDGEYMKALEKEEKENMADVAKIKQSLRDMPTDALFDQATTPDELKNMMPDYLA